MKRSKIETDNIKTNDWLVKGISPEQIQTEKLLAIIGAKINLKRVELSMDQKEFAKFMGVSQGMVSRWESGRYNFSISTLSSICLKLDLELDVDIKEKATENEKLVFNSKDIFCQSELHVWNPGRDTILVEGVA